MQYLLTEQEYENLNRQKNREHDRDMEEAAIRQLRGIILRARGGCIYDHEGPHVDKYCDDCQLGTLMMPEGMHRDAWKVMCSEPKHYSK